MPPQSWTVSDLFGHCVDLNDSERDAFLTELASTQPEVVAQVRKLLVAHDQAPGFLERPAVDHIREMPEGRAQPERGGFGNWVRSRPRAFWLFLAIDIVALGFYIFTVATIARYNTRTVDWGYDIELVAGEFWRVSSVDAQGSAAGILKPGDEIVAMNGDASTPPTAVMAGIESTRPGVPYRLRVKRDGTELEVPLTMNVTETPKLVGDLITFGMVSLAFFFTAVVLGWLKSDQRVAQRAYAALVSEALVLAKVLIGPYQPFLHGAPFVVYEVLSSLDGIHFALGYLFYCTLFDRVINTRRWADALYIFVPWAVSLTVFRIGLECGFASPLLDRHPKLLELVWALDPVYYVLAPLSICAVIARNYVKVRQPDDRRRARWIAFGSLAGILPYMFFKLAVIAMGSLGDPREPITDLYQNLRRVAILAAVMIPAATGYAIYKHRMFDIRVVIRQGVRYILAKSVLQAVLALPALGLLIALIRNAHKTIADAFLNNVSFIVLLALLAAVLKFRVPLRRWLDRRFFRESYHQEQILVSLIDGVQKLHSLSEMAVTVGESVESVFHPVSMAILYRTGSQRFFTPSYSTGRISPDLRIRDTSPLLALLEGDAEARQVASIQGLPGDEIRRFEALGLDLVVPMTGAASGVAGLILLGRKRADEPYTPEDRRLLAALAGQMAIVCENISLHQMLTDQRKSTERVRSRLEAGGVDGFRECPVCGRCYDLQVLRCAEDGAEPVFSLPIERTMGRYRLERLLGKGGMGAVYEAEDISLRRRVAVKIMTGSMIADATALERVNREARAAARLNHPNIIATYDFGLAGDAAYLVMELVAGETMRSTMNRGSVDAATIAEWFDQLLAGLDAAHRAGIVHRDLKPENVLISTAPAGGPLVKILDFGIAKTLSVDEAGSTSITRPGTVLGSIQYMSPEQFNGGRIDARSDLFSVGVMVFETLTGALPFSGNSHTERMLSVLHGEITIPPTWTGGAHLESALKKCMAKDPADRFASAQDLRATLVPLIAGHLHANA